jgi:hypothetical protein
MSGLAALLAGHNQPDLYQWHSAAHVPDIEHCVEHAGWKLAYLDGWTVEDRQTFLKATAAACELPDAAAASFDALASALPGVDAQGCAGVVVLWDGWSPLARHDQEAFSEALGVLRGRVHGDGCKFAVLLRGEGPSLDLPELPAKHA